MHALSKRRDVVSKAKEYCKSKDYTDLRALLKLAGRLNCY